MTDWTDALDAFERRLDDQRAALDTGRVTVEPFVPPRDLGPLPEALTPRARALLADARALEERIAGQVSAFRRAGTSASRAPSRPAAYFDRRA